MERHFGDLEQARCLLYKAVNAITDDPYEIFNALVQFEREEGTRDELDKALEVVNTQIERQAKRLIPKSTSGKEKKHIKGLLFFAINHALCFCKNNLIMGQKLFF